jgi:phosphatidate phosphatase PAH1
MNKTDILTKMDFLYKLKDYCNDINGTNFNGAIDVIVIKNKDNTYSSSPFHVRFGKIGVLKSKEKLVNIELNGKPVKGLLMKLCEYGEAWFLNEIKKEESEKELVINDDVESESFVCSTSSLSRPCSLKTNVSNQESVKHSNSESTMCNSFDNIDIAKYNRAAMALNSALHGQNASSQQSIKLHLVKSANNFKEEDEAKSIRAREAISGQNKTSKNEPSNLNKPNVEELALKSLLYEKSHYLTCEQLRGLNLRAGANTIKYSVISSLQGTTTIQSSIFLWNYNDKIIVSDIDGTITKSDILGQILPIIGRDWFHEGIADLFTSLEKNGYKILYLSARSICQYELTQSLLNNIKQSSKSLPKGPVLLNPINILDAFQVEVIEKKPDEFKIACLDNIKAIFARSLIQNPFYAGNFYLMFHI